MCVVALKKDCLPRHRRCLFLARSDAPTIYEQSCQDWIVKKQQIGLWNCIKEPTEHGTQSVIMRQTRIHRHTFVQFKLIARPRSWSTLSTFLAHSNRCRSRELFCGYAGNQYSAGSERSSCRRLRTTKQDVKFATSQHFSRSLRRATIHAKNRAGPLLVPCFYNRQRHDVMHVFDHENSQNMGKTFIQTRSGATVLFGHMPPECLFRMETLAGQTVQKKKAFLSIHIVLERNVSTRHLSFFPRSIQMVQREKTFGRCVSCKVCCMPCLVEKWYWCLVATFVVARLTSHTRKFGWWMSRRTAPRVAFDLPECEELKKNLFS